MSFQRVAVSESVTRQVHVTETSGEGTERRTTTSTRSIQELITRWIDVEVPEPPRVGLIADTQLQASTDEELTDLVAAQVMSGGIVEAAETLDEELSSRTPADQTALMSTLVQNHPEATGLLLSYTGLQDRHPTIAQSFGQVYEARLAADPASANAMLEDVLLATDRLASIGTLGAGDLGHVGAAVGASGSPALQEAAVELFLEHAAQLDDFAMRMGDTAGAYAHDAQVAGRAALNAADGLDTPMGRSLSMMREQMEATNFGFSVSNLRLGFLDDAGWARLESTLSFGSVTVDESLEHISTLQSYWGYDNQTMVSALREIYYPNLLDAFIADAGAIDPELHDLGAYPTAANGVSASDAAFAEAILFLSRQGQGYVSPMVDILPGANRPGFPAEFGLDHVIAGLDGYFHQQEGVNVPLYDWVIRAAGGDPAKLRSMNAVTWLGDLAGVVGVAIKREGTLAERTAAAYPVEMPFEDFHGNLMSFVVASAGIDPQGADLAGSLSAAFDPNGAAWQQRYETFAHHLGLTIDPTTGQITNREQFIAYYQPEIAALGRGLARDPWNSDAPALAEEAMEMFLDQLQHYLDV